jgi:3-oxoacyl-[acyl-carrier-protein] synthase-1
MTAVGLDAPSSCAAFRAKLTNPSPTRFMNSTGEWIVAHCVELEQPRRGLARLALMAATALDEALADVDRSEWPAIPLLLCVAEHERPGRLDGLDDELLDLIQQALGLRFAPESTVVAQGRIGVAVALAQARTLIGDGAGRRVAIAAADSLLDWPTLSHYDVRARLLTAENSNGFMPGEGAGALLVAEPATVPELVCAGIGFAMEPAPVDSEAPLRADGLSSAIRDALAEAGLEMHDIDYRIADLSGEQYYFKESALALSRTLHRPKAEFDLWHPAECTGEAGALAGAAIVALADAASRKGFGKGLKILAHMSADSGERAAIALRFGSG